jgi:hypothetical protein
MSKPSRCKGVDNNWIEAGAANCAIVAPLMVRPNSSPILAEITGPRSGGTLNDANIVRQSRIANRAYEGPGTARGGPPGPNSRAKAWSLNRHKPIFAVDEATNFVVPAVTSVAGSLRTVDVIVSSVFAVRYVPP